MIQLSLACSEKASKRSQVGIYRAPVKNASEPGIQNSAVTKITGAVVASFNGSISQTTFQNGVMGFATAFMLPEDETFGLGKVSSTYQEITDTAGTGLRLNLNVCLSNGGKINASQSYSNTSVRGASQPLTIYIKDSKVLDNSDDYSPIEISGYTVTGTINGKNMNLRFTNSLGTIIMEGDYNRSSDWFAGKISFNNSVNFVESQPAVSSPNSYYLGEFYVQMNTLSRNCN